MKRLLLFITLVLFAAGLAAFGLTGEEILSKVRENAESEDQHSVITMTVTESDGTVSVKKMDMKSMGNHRLIKVLEPADVRGVGFLVLNSGENNEQMYFYSPAFRKIRQITSKSEKGESFMGSDFSFEDMAQKGYSEKYDAVIKKEDAEGYVLELNPKKGSEGSYALLKMWVSKPDFVFTQVEFYNNSNKLEKVMKAEKIEEIAGHFMPTRMEVKNLLDDHTTVMVFESIDLNAGLSEKNFSLRYLKR